MKEYDFNTTPIVDIVNSIIIDAVNKNASDIHFDPAEDYLKVRFRVDGDLNDYSIIENKYKRNLITRVKLISGMNITESRLPQDGAIKGVINGKDLDMRVSALPCSFGEKVVIRILDYSMSMQGLETLGFTNENYELIIKMLENPNGIILITGATGSGKSTTVYSMLQRLNKEETNIITVEDPVEMNIAGINQVQVNSEIGLDFANVLRSILRQDPNIILIGEIRDSETAKIAIRSSITGHLVLSTLHTNNSLTTIERLLDMDVERYLLSSSLKGIISQTLAKRLCKDCYKLRPTTDTEKRIFQKSLHKEVNEIYDAVGCDKCHNGYKGRIALQEVLLIDDQIRDAINNNIPRNELRELIYKKRKVKTLLQDGLSKVLDGTTSLKEVLKLVDIDENSEELYGKDDSKLEKDQEEIKQEQIIKKDEIEIEIPEENKQIENEEIDPQEINHEENKPKINFDEINKIINTNNVKEDVNKNINIDNLINMNPKEETYVKQVTSITDNKNINLNDTQDIFKLYDNVENKNQETPTNKEPDLNKTNNYTNDLIKLINEGFFE